MITLLLAAAALHAPFATPQTIELIPTDDVWVYPRAANQDSDEYLRVWGGGDVSVASDAVGSEDFGYAFLKFGVGDVPKGKTLKTAVLVLTHIPEPAFTLDAAKAYPLEVRPMPNGFGEKTWDYAQLSKFMPDGGKDAAFGKGAPEKLETDKEFPISIDLLKGPGNFAKYLEAAQKSGPMALALTSAMSPDDGIYKFYSKDGPKAFRPVLRLTFE
ncbi:MAG: hypothetical protein M9921_06005 [Fimbriimonadaceae bacterium]|nr:hypothetical protein [Chthonomonadaceae bacterium]MCO5296393.1 hypothetical protein [Fimbriimonadaceae bacterium]